MMQILPKTKLMAGLALFALLTGTFAFNSPPAYAAAENVVWTALVNATASGNTITGGSGVGGGVSTQSITSGDGYIQFTVAGIDGNRAAGLNNGSANQSLAEIDYAIRYWGGGAEVWENGIYQGETTYSPNDVLRIEIVSGTVRYRKNGVVFYISAMAPSYPLKADTSIATPNASVNNAIMSSERDMYPPWVTIPSPTGTLSGTVTVSANAFDDDGGSGVAAMWFTLDRSIIGQEDNSYPYSVSWDTTTVADGVYSLEAFARDNAGNVDFSHPVSYVTVDNSSPPSGDYPHEPDGFVSIAEYAATAMPVDGPTSDISACTSSGVIDGCWWKVNPGGNITIVSESSAQKSPSGVIQFRYPDGLQPGTGVGLLQGWDTGDETSNTEYREVYESGWLRTVLPTFENQAIGTKVFGYWGVGQADHVPNQFYGLVEGNGETDEMDTMSMRFALQNHVDRSLPQTDPEVKFTPGAWHRYELYLKLNDIGSSNGVFRLWFDDVLIFDYSDVQFRNAANPNGFYGRRLDPVWGGMGGDPKTRNDFLQYDHIYISGIPLP